MGIVTVVLIHSVRPAFSPDVSAGELRIGELTRFAVPGFLAASGYLYALAGPNSAADTRRRLLRIGIPYLVASFAAQLFWLLFDGRAPAAGALLADLALGAAFGPYYYVPIAALCVALAPGLARLGARGLALATIAALALQWLCQAVLVLPVFWALRNPLYWLGFFVAGWWLGAQRPAVSRWLAGRRALAAAAFGTGFAAVQALRPLAAAPVAAKTLLLLSVWCALGLLLALALGRGGAHPLVRRLSDSTYTIYLFHLFFLLPLQAALPAAPGVFDPVAIGLPWLAGLAGPLALAALGRALLGARSRTLLGA